LDTRLLIGRENEIILTERLALPHTGIQIQRPGGFEREV